MSNGSTSPAPGAPFLFLSFSSLFSCNGVARTSLNRNGPAGPIHRTRNIAFLLWLVAPTCLKCRTVTYTLVVGSVNRPTTSTSLSDW